MSYLRTPFTLSIIAIFLLFPAFTGKGGKLAAEIVTLKTGQTIRGEILLDNDAVVIIRNSNGAKFQYLKNDIVSIETEETNEPEIEVLGTQSYTPKSKKVFMSISIAGGGFSAPHQYTGGAFSADLLIGSHHIGNSRIFVGGGLGFHSYWSKEAYAFLPLMVVLGVPVIDGVHAPEFGASIGYGFSLKANATHGLYAGIDAGYRYQKSKKTALYVGLFATFQQTSLSVRETISAGSSSHDYDYRSGSNLIGYGVRCRVYF